MLRISIFNRALDYTHFLYRGRSSSSSTAVAVAAAAGDDELCDTDNNFENDRSLGLVTYSDAAIPATVCSRTIFSSGVPCYLLSQKQHDIRSFLTLSLSKTFHFTRDIQDLTLAGVPPDRQAETFQRVAAAIGKLFQLRSIGLTFLPMDDGDYPSSASASGPGILAAVCRTCSRTLEELTIASSFFTNEEEVLLIGTLDHLLVLELNACELPDAGTLAKILFVEDNVNDGGHVGSTTSSVARLKRLEHLMLAELNDATMLKLANSEYVPRLKTLILPDDTMSAATLTSRGLAQIGKFWRLEELNLLSAGERSRVSLFDNNRSNRSSSDEKFSQEKQQFDLFCPSELGRLKSLSVDWIGIEVLSHLPSLATTMEVLRLPNLKVAENCVGFCSLEALRAATHLKVVDLMGLSGVEDFSPLASSAATLEELHLARADVSPSSLSFLMNRIASVASPPRLHLLNLSACELLDAKAAQWLPAVCKVKSLRSLKLATLDILSNVSCAMMEQCLRGLSSLESLCVATMSISIPDEEEKEKEKERGQDNVDTTMSHHHQRRQDLNCAAFLKIVGGTLSDSLLKFDCSQNAAVDEKGLRGLEKMRWLRELDIEDCNTSLITDSFWSRMMMTTKKNDEAEKDDVGACFPALEQLVGTHDGTKESVKALVELKRARPALFLRVTRADDAHGLAFDDDDGEEECGGGGYNYSDDDFDN